MADTINIVVPDLGDFADVEVIEILVGPGDPVAREDGLITLETDKATMEVPAPNHGTVQSISVSNGDTVSSGDVIGTMTIEVGDTVVVTPAIEAEIMQGETTVVASPEPAGGGVQTLEVPDLGDFEDVEVIEIHVSAGSKVDIDESLLTLETDKATMDVPATVSGTIESVLVDVGDKVSKGSPIAVIDAVATVLASTPQAEKTQTMQVQPAPPKPATQTARPRDLPPIDEAGFSKAHASPSVRKLARELGVDLSQVTGSGEKKRILHDDVKAFVKAILSGGGLATGPSLPQVPKVDFAKFGEIETQPLTRIQKISGPRLQASWINLPHVTQHDLADITALEAKRQELKGPAKEKGIGLTPLAFIMKACVAALKEFPKVNASLSADDESLVYKKYCHLGFAADTENGLMVPVIRDADKMDVYELASELAFVVGWVPAMASSKAEQPAGRVIHDLEPWRNRRHCVHADRQCARSCHSRGFTIIHAAGLEWHGVCAPADVARLVFL